MLRNVGVWCLCALLFILGSYCFYLSSADVPPPPLKGADLDVLLRSSNGNMKPVFIGMLSFGGIFILTRVYKGMSKALLFPSLAVVGIAGIIPRFFTLDYAFFFEWSAWTLILGIPVMWLSFNKLD